MFAIYDPGFSYSSKEDQSLHHEQVNVLKAAL
jgi:hypothetical protein